MPRLSFEDNCLFLNLTYQEMGNNPGIEMFFGSILGMNFDQKNMFSYSSEDIVKVASLIKKVLKRLDALGFTRDLDYQCQRILSLTENSDKELRESILAGLDIKEKTHNIPEIPEFIRQLKPYQIKSVIHATNCYNVANFSVPGSGKTTIAYATFSILRANKLVDSLLIIGPRSSFMPWEEEFEACFGRPSNSLRIVGNNNQIAKTNLDNIDIILLTYQMASNIVPDLIKILCSKQFLLILDESHHVKKFKGGLWSDSVIKIAPFAKRRLILSGTPMPNSLLDLWSQFTFLWPFRNLMGERVAFETSVNNDMGTNRIKETIHPFYTRITKNQLGLPPPKFIKTLVPLNRVQRSIYNAIATRILGEINATPLEIMRLRDWRRNRIIRLLQAASNPTLLTEYSDEFRIPPLQIEGFSVVKLIEKYSQFEIPNKLVSTERLVRKLLADGEKVIVWTTFIRNIKTLRKMLRDKNPLEIYGDIPKDENEDEFLNREKIIKEFKSDSRPRVLIANPNSLAESVSLHKICKNAIYVDRTFNAGQYIQSLDRIHRIGLDPKDTITYHILCSRDTIDEVIDTRLDDKYQRMLNMLNDDLNIFNLETEMDEVSDEELENDFQAVTKQLLTLKDGEPSDR